ncbi:MAG: hypothetical protein JWL83_1569 [Actinomycetia bacterium]|jgi:hypothetical protein|nr:hypothetical protein [Actinomycetes bacterium]
MATTPRRPNLGRVAIVAAGLLIAGNLLWFAGVSHSDSTPQLPTQLKQLFPASQQVIRPQDTVGAQLDGGLQGVLYINGGQVPADQVNGDPGLGLITFRPGCGGTNVSRADCEYTEFQPGTMNLRVDYWPQTETIQTAKQRAQYGTFSWQIKVG